MRIKAFIRQILNTLSVGNFMERFHQDTIWSVTVTKGSLCI